MLLAAAMRGLALPWAAAGLALAGNVLLGFAAACVARTQQYDESRTAATAPWPYCSISGQDEATARAALAELVRREVLAVSADRLSPERGSYGFAQNMLRQVAYDTLSRRDRKSRHLALAAHPRAAFPGDGEEVAEVIARHYLDAVRRGAR